MSNEYLQLLDCLFRYGFFVLFLWDLASLSQHHCIKDTLTMKIYPHLCYRCEINETDVNCTCNLQKVWDSSDSLNENTVAAHYLSLFDLQFQWSVEIFEHDGMRSPWERAIFRYFIFLDKSFRSLTLRRKHLHSQHFKLRRDCM